MIVLDIETSGLYPEKHGIWQIGALESETKKEFLDEARIDDEDIVEEEALKVTGKTEEELKDKDKQSQKHLLQKFFNWLEKARIKNFICQNPQFDIDFVCMKARKYGLEFPFHYRSFDLHSIAQTRHYQVNRKFLINKLEKRSDMGLSSILEFCGLEDERRILEKGKVIKEGKPHNALEDCKLIAECFSRLLYGKNMFPEYTKFKIPNYLKK